MASPSLLIRRVVVEGELSCDLKFEPGLNIIQAVPNDGDLKSTNSTGKTALVELIQHGLGKRQKSATDWHFKPIIDQVNTLWLSIEADGELLTIERSLRKLNAAARIREGMYVPSIRNAPSELINIEDMSDVLLNALKIPRVKVKMEEGALTPLSFPLLMRAFILHQEDSFNALLDKVQPDKRKADIIGFLIGITPIQRFEIEDELSNIQLEYQKLENYFQAVQAFLIESGVPSLIEAQAQLSEAERELQQARDEQLRVQSKIRQAVNQEPSDEGVGRLEELRSRIFSIKDRIIELEHNYSILRREEDRMEEVRASLFVDRQKAQRLGISVTILSGIEFSICPRCLLDITPEMQQREQYARCCLCNRPLSVTSDTLPRIMPKTEDIDIQIEEAETVLENVRGEIILLLHEIEELRHTESIIGRMLDEEAQVYVSPAIDRLLSQTYDVTYKEVTVNHSRNLSQQAEALNDIKKRLDEFLLRKASLEERLKEVSQPNQMRLEVLRQIYEGILRAVDFPNFKNW